MFWPVQPQRAWITIDIEVGQVKTLCLEYSQHLSIWQWNNTLKANPDLTASETCRDYGYEQFQHDKGAFIILIVDQFKPIRCNRNMAKRVTMIWFSAYNPNVVTVIIQRLKVAFFKQDKLLNITPKIETIIKLKHLENQVLHGCLNYK